MTSTTERWYFRCHVCLGVFVTEESAGSRWVAPPPCPYCGGDRVEIMGHVNRGQVSLTGDAAPCDGSCTAALGPLCVCHCGGENHGTRRVVRFERVAGEEAAVVRLADAAARDAAKFRRQSEEWRSLLAEAEAAVQIRWGEVTERKWRGEYLQGADWVTYRRGQDARRRVREAVGLKVHALRMRRLAEILQDVEPIQTEGRSHDQRGE